VSTRGENLSFLGNKSAFFQDVIPGWARQRLTDFVTLPEATPMHHSLTGVVGGKGASLCLASLGKPFGDLGGPLGFYKGENTAHLVSFHPGEKVYRELYVQFLDQARRLLGFH